MAGWSRVRHRAPDLQATASAFGHCADSPLSAASCMACRRLCALTTRRMRPRRWGAQMSSSEFNWESLLCTDTEGRSLKAGLFTTYDRADGRLLAEHLLPVLLHRSEERRVGKECRSRW